MAMNFGKGNRAIAFNPTSAFPLDARTYFESLEAARAAAATAVEVGSSDSIYYFGQTLVVVEESVAKFYIIQPDHTLSAVAGESDAPVEVAIDEHQFAYVDGKLSLKNFDNATEGKVLSVDAAGNLAWVVPVDAYTKAETDAKIAEAGHLKRKIVTSVEDIDKDAADAEQYIYMVPNGLTDNDDKYDEYMVITVADVRFVEKVGTWAVDLQDYAKKTDLDDYVKKVEGSRLITTAEANKLAEVEKNVINSVNSEFAINEDRELSLVSIPTSKVTGLNTALGNKVDKIEGWTLLSPADQEKLGKLTVGDSGNLEVSGTVNASNVKELDAWITNNREDVSGLLSADQETRLEGLFDQVGEGLAINTVEEKKQLDITSIPISKVTDLASQLNAKAVKSEVDTSISNLDTQLNIVSTKVTNLEGLLNDYVTLETYTKDKTEIYASITWGDLK